MGIKYPTPMVVPLVSTISTNVNTCLVFAHMPLQKFLNRGSHGVNTIIVSL